MYLFKNISICRYICIITHTMSTAVFEEPPILLYKFVNKWSKITLKIGIQLQNKWTRCQIHFLVLFSSLCLGFILQNHNLSFHVSTKFFRFGDCISYYVSGVQRTESGVIKVVHYPKDPYLPQKHWNFPLFHLAILLLKMQDWRGGAKHTKK